MAARPSTNALVRTLYFIVFLDMLGVSMIIGIMIQAFKSRGISPSLTGLVGSVYGATQIFSGPIIGRLGDVYGRKKFMFLSYMIPGLSYLILGTTSSVYLLIVSRILNGVFKQGQLCSRAYITEQIPSDKQSAILGYFNSCSSLGFIIGPLVGGYLAEMDPQLGLPFIASAGVFFTASMVILLMIPETRNNITKTATFNWREVFSSLNIFEGFKWSEQYDILLFRFVSSLSVITYRRNFTIFLEEVHGMTGKHWTKGMIMSFNAVVGMIASSFAGRVSKYYRSQSKLLVHMTILMCLAMIGSVWLPWLPVTIICLIPLSVATANLRIASVKVMLTRGDQGQKGALIGIGASVTSLARALGPSVVGVAQEYSSVYSGYMSSGLGVASLLLAFNVY